MQRDEIASGTGSFTVAAPGARISELRCAPRLPNVLYEGPAVVAGGDRLWPAPELDVFYDSHGVWRAPPEIDPGDWATGRMTDGVRFDQEAAGMRMSRTVTPIQEPPAPTDLPWSGYAVSDRVAGHPRRSAWHLVMLPTPQGMYVRGPGDPVVYYAPAPAPDEGWLLTGSTAARWKVGFAAAADGHVLLAALSPVDPGALVVVLSEADPTGTYLDVPPGGGPATAVQLYDSGTEGFCELEHHAPVETGTCESVVFAAWGSREDRVDLLRRIDVHAGLGST